MKRHRFNCIVIENVVMLITPNFTLEEMITSQIASREGLDNTPSAEAMSNMRQLCQALEQVRALFGRPVIVSSGYRSAAVNARVGGARNSQHTQGLAADFTIKEVSNREVVQRVSESTVAFDQLILEFDSWVHLSVAVGAPRREVLTIRRGTGYLPGLQ
jgi:zinc D-Ala-D-Ala carboxypeptidase